MSPAYSKESGEVFHGHVACGSLPHSPQVSNVLNRVQSLHLLGDDVLETLVVETPTR